MTDAANALALIAIVANANANATVTTIARILAGSPYLLVRPTL